MTDTARFDLKTRAGRYRARLAGFPIPKMRPGPRQVVLDDHIIKTENCWLWTGRKNQWGYGVLTRLGKTCFAHREMWERAQGRSAKGLVIRHNCDNPSCVNPDHLLSGSPADNIRDKVKRGRQAKGERNGSSKLTSQQVARIRRDWQSGVSSQKALAKEHGVHIDTVHKIVHNKLWRHVCD